MIQCFKMQAKHPTNQIKRCLEKFVHITEHRVTGKLITYCKPEPSFTTRGQQVDSVLLHRIQDAEDVQEQVDDVQVQVDGGQDVFLWGELVHDQVCVVDNEATEEQGPCPGEYQLYCLIVEEELQEGTGRALTEHAQWATLTHTSHDMRAQSKQHHIHTVEK